jgi:predicted nucleotidyltransferase
VTCERSTTRNFAASSATNRTTWFQNEAEVDLVTHDLAKFLRLMLRRNGYVLEQVLSPLVVMTSRCSTRSGCC